MYSELQRSPISEPDMRSCGNRWGCRLAANVSVTTSRPFMPGLKLTTSSPPLGALTSSLKIRTAPEPITKGRERQPSRLLGRSQTLPLGGPPSKSVRWEPSLSINEKDLQRPCSENLNESCSRNTAVKQDFCKQGSMPFNSTNRRAGRSSMNRMISGSSDLTGP